jgi:alpha-mannosidase
MTTRKPLYYTFGNHMHWVDMQWLWGYEVLPGSVRDMLHLCRETGAKGCVNFDAVGYEKMAAECPEALAVLREAVAAGTIEPVGCSYGQPYGLFQGGESNIRQFTYGVRTTRRLLGVRPRTFWEEEFYFFPQLPQVLASCGYTGANLFFQWTWHTPEVPKEAASLILWEGADGTRIPTLPRNTLNVHQWPEDFDGLLEQGLINELEAPAIVQWLELMPSKDWMCRSEVLLPRLKELFADPRFDLRPGTCADIIASLMEPARMEPDAHARVTLPIRNYTMDQVWHGMLLGKNADRHPRTGRMVERRIVEAEALAGVAGLFGRPYASWDIYPTWEVDEAWRELLSAQHHDNHECEGLCGFVGYHSMDRARSLACEVSQRTRAHLEQRCKQPVLGNPLGWARTVAVRAEAGSGGEGLDEFLLELPPFGYATRAAEKAPLPDAKIDKRGHIWTLSRAGLEVDVDVERALILQIRSASHPRGVLDPARPLLDIRRIVEGDAGRKLEVESADEDGTTISIAWKLDPPRNGEKELTPSYARGTGVDIEIAPDGSGVDIRFSDMSSFTRPDPGFTGAMRTEIAPAWSIAEIRADTAYAVQSCKGTGRASRKYPTGDWMTSPQWFEHVVGAIFAHSFIDLLDDAGRGLLIAHNGSQQWFRTERGVEVILNAYCPWDEARYQPEYWNDPQLRLIPHGPLADVERVRRAAEISAIGFMGSDQQWLAFADEATPVGGGDRTISDPAPDIFGALEVSNAPNVLAHAFYRDSMKSGEHLPDWAGHRMARESAGACTHPFVIRLVEWNGEPAEVAIKLPGPVALAAKTNLLGETGPWTAGPTGLHGPADAPAHLRDTGWIALEPTTPPDWAKSARFRGAEIPWSLLRFTMRPREIATVMADLVMGRKQFRDLDAKREVWATVHRTGE